MMEALIGIDVGTSSTKAVLFDRTGKELARSVSDPYPNYTPNPGWVEQDPETLWQALLSVIREVMAQVAGELRVLALCMAAQSGSLLPVDSEGEPIYRLITWMDLRTETLARQWRANGLEEQVKALSGWSLYPGACLLSVAWLRENMPDVFSAAHTYFSVNDFLAFRLTGEYCTNPSNAGGMVLLDIRSGRWNSELCSLAGIGEDQLSSVRPAGTVVGEVLPDICQATGLPTGVLLINGGHDQGCTALGLGINSPGKLLLACGTAWVITGVTTSPDIDQANTAVELNFHPAPGRWTISQSLGGLGASLEWWINQAWRGVQGEFSRESAYASLDDELENIGARDDRLMFHPLTGGHVDQARSNIGGFDGLRLEHTRAALARAIMESAAFELRWSIETLRGADLPVDRLWMVGGAARSPYWPAILSTVTDVPIYVPDYDNWPASGAAILAGLGAGLLENIADGLSYFEKPVREVQPDDALRSSYDQSFTSYKLSAQTFKPLSPA